MATNQTNSTRTWRVQTAAIHAGNRIDPVTRSFKRPIVMASNADLRPDEEGRVTPYVYTRACNPTIEGLEERLAVLEEGAEACIFTASGMAAVSTVLFHALRSGGHAILAETLYSNTKWLFTEGRLDAGVSVDFVDATDARNIAAALRDDTKIVYIESPDNPLLQLTDIAAVAQVVRPHSALLAIDSTFSGMMCQHPLKLGVDVVIHSATKYINGHGDALGGAVLGRREIIEPMRRTMMLMGGCASPFNAFLVTRGVSTLPLRMKAHCDNAMTIARWLQSHEKVAQVRYPGLPDHPQHELARRQMPGGFGGVLRFTLRTDQQGHRDFVRRLRMIVNAVSLGDLETLIMYFTPEDLLRLFDLPDREARFRAMVGQPGIVRLSVGLEHPDDIIADLEQSLEAVEVVEEGTVAARA